MRKSWLTAASVLAAAAVEGHPAQAQNFTTTPATNPSPASNPLPFGDVRIGTTSSPQSLSVTNSVKLDSGSIAATTAPFSGGNISSFPSLASKAVTNTSFTFSPTDHVSSTDSVDITAAATSGKVTTTQTNTLTLTGTGVGPIYSSTPGVGTIDFGNVAPGATVVEDLKISNTSTDPGGTLTGLSLLAAGLTGASGFTLGNSLPGTPLAEGNTFDLKIDFTAPSMLGLETADLKITTDQNAALGKSGTVFDYTLKADVVAAAVPEPASIGLLASGLAGAAGAGLWRRRRRPR